MTDKIAIIGAGLIGRAWSMVFARAGRTVALYDVERTALPAAMAAMGQVPVSLNKEIPGFLLNRLQGALLGEAFRLVEQGYCSMEDIDRTVKDGLGLRWSFMGPFETIDLNAPGGIADYIRRYGPAYYEMAQSAGAPEKWSAASTERLEAERRESLPAEQ